MNAIEISAIVFYAMILNVVIVALIRGYVYWRDWRFNGWHLPLDSNFEFNIIWSMKFSGKKWRQIAAHIERLPVYNWRTEIQKVFIDPKSYHKTHCK